MAAMLKRSFCVMMIYVVLTLATVWDDYSELWSSHSVDEAQAMYGSADEPLDYGIPTAIWNSLAESFECGLPSNPYTFQHDWDGDSGFPDGSYWSQNYGYRKNYSRFGFPMAPLSDIVPGVSQLKSSAEFGWGRYYYCEEHFPNEDRATCFWKQINREKCRQKYLKETLPSEIWDQVKLTLQVTMGPGKASVLFMYIMCLENDAQFDYCPFVCNQRMWACEEYNVGDIDSCTPIGNGLFAEDFTCSCRSGYIWDWNQLQYHHCVRVDICNSFEEYPCNFAGTMSCELTEESFVCHCKGQYTGKTCAELYNACVLSPVQWYPEGDRACGEGVCHTNIGTQEYTCECPDEYGDSINSPWLDCDRRLGVCDTLPCEHGNCVLDGLEGTCVCDDGYEGDDCSQAVTHWSAWGAWEECVPECGHDRWRSRQRQCVVGDMGIDCQPAPVEQSKPCAHLICLVNGEWTTWSEWSSCTVDCGGGTKERTRTCTYNTPYGELGWGEPCGGQDTDMAWCNTWAC